MSYWKPPLLGIAGIAAFALMSQTLFAGSDVLIMKNGDRITGEIKKLERGNIHIDADYGDSNFVIDWEEVERVESQGFFVVETADGKRLSGSLRTDPDQSAQILVESPEATAPIPQSEIVNVKPVDDGFWGRFGAAVDFGFSLTKAEETKQLSSRVSADYLSENWYVAGNINAFRNVRKDATNTRRTEGGANYRRFLGNRWFATALSNFFSSDELELALRSTAGGGMGRYLVQNNRWYFAVIGGAAWTNENFQSVEIDKKNSAEAFGTLEFNAFDIGDLNIMSRLGVIPSLTESKRTRINFDVDFKWDLPKDLYFSIGFTDNYDSSPPTDTKNDYIFNTSVGWSF